MGLDNVSTLCVMRSNLMQRYKANSKGLALKAIGDGERASLACPVFIQHVTINRLTKINILSRPAAFKATALRSTVAPCVESGLKIDLAKQVARSC